MAPVQKHIQFHPMISGLQKVNLYEDKNVFYLMGTNNCESRYRVLKIDRTEPKELRLDDDKKEYTKFQIHKLVEKIESSHRRQRSTQSAKKVSAFGIVGFVRFTEGYYIILITKRQQVAVIGHHIIYKIKNTSLEYIPQDVSRSNSPIEKKYYKIFQNIDLSSNFYFSYSYDLTHSLQMNMSQPSDFPLSAFETTPTEDGPGKPKEMKETLHFGVRSKPNERFIWNWNLLKSLRGTLHPDWILHVIHGFVDQSNLCVFGRNIYISLIARRSRMYAGTRFLKRGANFEGDVANEVETEQLVHDAGISSFEKGRYTSFVQMRGSIPGHWSQAVTKMVPKPQIGFDVSDPYGETSGKHFNKLLRRYGSPVIILNLVKKRETKRQESVLSEELIKSVKYLNQFLPPKHHLRYTSFDMARINKKEEENVMQRLADIARSCVLKTGIFVSHPSPSLDDPSGTDFLPRRYQTGILRVNCVDCLDRTNTAQFAVGRWALGEQLRALGIITDPSLKFDSDCIRMLEALYEDHGDTLALQYGGSQLVHRIKTYRKTAPWTSQGNDIMQTLSRYFSNTFSDADKQNAINLFLGLFQPNEKGPHIWDYVSDYYLHQSWAMGKIEQRMRPLSQWWDPEILDCLPRSYEEMNKQSLELCALLPDDETIDGYSDFHRPQERTILKDTFTSQMSHSLRDFIPTSTIDLSPFTVRVYPGRRREESGRPIMKNPSLTGKSSTSSTTSSGTSSASASEDSLSEDEFDRQTDSPDSKHDDVTEDGLMFASFFPPMAEIYGVQPHAPSKGDILIYKRYEKTYQNSITRCEADMLFSGRQFRNSSKFTNDSSISTTVLKTKEESIKKYQAYVSRGVRGASEPKAEDLLMYRNYMLMA